jgi:hypothetical protein
MLGLVVVSDHMPIGQAIYGMPTGQRLNEQG